MTPRDYAEELAPQVREAAERSKKDLLSNLPPFKRALVKGLWSSAMTDGVPFLTQVVIEFLISKYRHEIEPMIGKFVEALIPALGEEDDARLQKLKTLLELLKTPSTEFHPVVQECLNPMASHAPVDYSKESD